LMFVPFDFFQGHSADGGAITSDIDIDGENITDTEAAKISMILGEDSKIIIISCAQADDEDNDFIQRLASKTKRNVVGERQECENIHVR